MRPERKDADFSERVERQVARKRRGRRGRYADVWYGISLFGLVGWSVALPTFLGALGGAFLDRTFPQPFSWTLVGMGAGLALGCLNVWRWLARERGRFEERDHD